MSTKIVSGTASTRALTWPELDALLNDYATRAREIAQKRLTRVLAFKAAHLHDRRMLGLVDGDPNDAVIDVMVSLMTKVTNAIDSNNERRDPTHDVGCEVWVGYDKETDRHLFNIFAEHEEYREAWNCISSLIVPFAYWNNTDRSDDVSEPDWDDRRAIWDRVLQRHGAIWGANGLVRTIIGKYGWPHPELDEETLAAAGPTLEERVQMLSRALAVTNASAPQTNEGEKPYAFFRRISDWLQTRDGQEVQQREASRVREQIAGSRPYAQPAATGACP
jgi:hypothetical protein